MKILFYKWKVYNQEDIETAFIRQGHEIISFEESKENRESENHEKLINMILSTDIVFSVNYFPHVSAICNKYMKKYIVWTVDSPMLSMFDESVYNKYNYIFVFDMFYYYRFKDMGVKNIYYLPLACDGQRVEALLKNCSEWDINQYNAEISFVGGMYHKNSYDDIYDSLSPYLRGYFDAAMRAQMNIYGYNIFDDVMTVDILQRLCEQVKLDKKSDSLSDIGLVFSSTFLGYKLAQLERIEILNRLAKKHSVDLYTDEPDSALKNVRYRGCVNYSYDMPKVFNRSKINLNITIRNIRSGIPLRVWDILGANGFLLTNFQAELPKYFENNKDIVYYEGIQDLTEKADYYLKHDDIRREIADNGHKKVMLYHSYDIRIKRITDIIENKNSVN